MDELGFVKKEISEIPDIKHAKHRVLGIGQLSTFWKRTIFAYKIMFTEKENFLFVLLQLIIIGLVYYIWIQMFAWIPESVWRSEDSLSELVLNLIFLAWSFLLVGLASFPIGILSGCIGASYFLRKQGHQSTISRCLQMVLPKAMTLWPFFWIDGWITVSQILARLPKKRYQTNSALQELLYFSWKLGTIGILPAVLNGRNLIDAGKESVMLVRYHPKEALLLRGGYSLVCWIVGIAAYIGAIYFFIVFSDLFGTQYEVYRFYFWIGIPILVSLSVVLFFLRPIYIIASCAFYTDYVKAENISIHIPSQLPKITRAIIAFLILIIIIELLFIYREPLGIMNILRGNP